jgi:transposase
MKYVGIDLHSDCFTCCYLSEGKQKKMVSYHLDKTGIDLFKQSLDKKTYLMVEASTNSFRFAERIQDSVKEIIIANTHQLKLISFVNKKTDKIDAEKLAVILKMQIKSNERLFIPVHLPEGIIQELRSLFSTYRLLRKQVTSIKNRIHSLYKQELMPFTKTYIFGKKSREKLQDLSVKPAVDFQLDLLFSDLEAKENSIHRLEEYVLYLGQAYRRQIAILTSMTGISVFTAIAIVADIGELSRFKNSKHLSSYLRSAPGIDSSNETTRILSTSKQGRRLAVTLLSQSLNHFRNTNPKLHQWYQNKVAGGKKKGVIRMALCRKVITEIYQMLKNGEYHYYRNEVLHKKKMQKYIDFLKTYDPGDRYAKLEFTAA